ncbi:hypothetical protein C791_7371 [Amycolatopsis azurea DSM 43854]|uniref:Uncharacterized protein n=1 Tax=Amycolatopsis azurea DSM 43854 TaxID=1238180 RepID=M2Q9C5_9PSEU|nr:hypothetical protein C791_7371 [Amycolatopsis azurea DSM 43854]
MLAGADGTAHGVRHLDLALALGTAHGLDRVGQEFEDTGEISTGGHGTRR